MEKSLFFRVSANEYKENDIIYPKDSSFSVGEDKRRKIIEDALNAASTVGNRSDYLFLFDSLENALLYLRINKAYSHIYLVDVEDDDMVAKCDMNFIDGMMYLTKYFNDINDPSLMDLLNKFSKDYWNSGATTSPCREYLFKKATVKQCIFSVDEVRRKELKQGYDNNGRRILELDDFKELYKKVYL